MEFQYGASSGRGRDLEIALLQKDPGQPRLSRPRLGGMQSITLKKLDYLHIATAGSGLFGAPGGGKPEGEDNATLEITCQDEFAFDIPEQLARFVERVEVRRLVAGLPPDHLRCDKLMLAFDQRKQRPSATAVAVRVKSGGPVTVSVGLPDVAVAQVDLDDVVMPAQRARFEARHDHLLVFRHAD